MHVLGFHKDTLQVSEKYILFVPFQENVLALR